MNDIEQELEEDESLERFVRNINGAYWESGTGISRLFSYAEEMDVKLTEMASSYIGLVLDSDTDEGIDDKLNVQVAYEFGEDVMNLASHEQLEENYEKLQDQYNLD